MVYIYICIMYNELRHAKFPNQRLGDGGKERDLMDFCRSKGEQKAQTSAESMVESVTGHPMAGCSEEEAAGFLGT
jgi:hypothetical protein